MDKLTVRQLYDLSHTAAAPLLERCTYPWEALEGIKDFILELGPRGCRGRITTTPRQKSGLPKAPR